MTDVCYNDFVDKFEFNKGGEVLARHEFGIMQDAPKPRKRYDEYEPNNIG